MHSRSTSQDGNWKAVVSHVFQPGTVIAAGETLYATASVAAFRSRTTGPSGGQSLIVQEWNSGAIAGVAGQIRLVDTNEEVVATFGDDAETIAGDANMDGAVSFADFLILSANFGSTDAAFADGDFDDDGTVSFTDFLILSANFGMRG